MATTVTKTVTLIPSGTTDRTNITEDGTYGASRGYTDASSTTYARYTYGSAVQGYVYYTFDTSDIPSTATITSVTARGKARVNNTSRVTNTGMQLFSGTTAKGSATAFAMTTASTQNLSPGSGWTRSDLNDLRIRIIGTGSGSSTKRFDFYGADVTITYIVPVYTISASGDGTLDPSTSQTVEGGGSYTLRIGGLNTKPTVTDNSVDVTSQLVESTDATVKLIPQNNTNSGWYSVTDISNAYTDADSDTRATLQLAGGGTTATIYLDLGGATIPSGATIQSVSASATLEYGRNNSSSGFTASCQMYANTTAKGSSTSVVSAGGTDVAKTTFNLTVGSWTASDIANARFYLTATNNASSTRRYIYIYGVSFNVTYESDGVIYVYTLSNVGADHTIVVTAASAAQDKLFIKLGSSGWTEAVAVYKKTNGSWVAVSDLTTAFDSNTNYKLNGGS